MSESFTILVVEDNDFVRMQMVTFLREDGYQILEATEGGDALDFMASEDVDLAIVDVRMEPMGGFDFLQNVRADGRGVPVVLVTGDQDPDLLARANNLGVAAVMLKPVEKDRLLNTVRRTIASSKRLA